MTKEHRIGELKAIREGKLSDKEAEDGWGVDGWGNERNPKGGILDQERTAPLYPHRKCRHSHQDSIQQISAPCRPAKLFVSIVVCFLSTIRYVGSATNDITADTICCHDMMQGPRASTPFLRNAFPVLQMPRASAGCIPSLIPRNLCPLTRSSRVYSTNFPIWELQCLSSRSRSR